MLGSIINTVMGAGIKLGANLINFWLEQKRHDQMMIAARDAEMLKALIDNQNKQASDPFVKVTRRILFLSITFTMCFLMIFYAMNPHISYDVIVQRGDNSKWGIWSFVFGGTDWVQTRLTGGLMLSSFIDLCFMVVGFYAIPSNGK